MGQYQRLNPPHTPRSPWIVRAVTAAWLGVCPLTACAAAPAQQAEPANTAPAAQPAPHPAAAVSSRPETTHLTADQQRDLALLTGILSDNKIDLAKRRAAAAGLLSRGWPAAIEALDKQLSDASDPAGQRAVASALGASGDNAVAPPPALADALLKLIAADNDALRRDVATALGRYEDGPVMQQLIAWATDPDQPVNVRTGAINVLAEHRQPESAAALVSLTDAKNDPAIRNAAFDALTELTGNTDIGRDAAGWRAWWQAHRNLPRDRWLAQLVRSLSQQKRDLLAEQATLTARLADAYGQLYVATVEADRPAMLIRMLDDPIVTVRLAALRLIERNLLNAQSPAQAVREKLRTRLSDDSPLVRASAAALLRDIDDDTAADQVADQLLTEPDTAAQNAYLSLLARKPRAAAIQPALQLLDRPETRSAAANMLIAALDAGLLEPERKAKALNTARAAIQHSDSPDPAVVRLFGRLVSPDAPDDRALVENLLNHADAAVRRAAAEAYVSGSLPIGPLLAKIDDPTLAARALEAAGRRGDSLDTATLLLDHPPQQRELAPTWRSALVAVAGRLDAPALLRLDDAMIADKSPADLCIAVLKQAMQIKEASPQRTELLLRLGRLELDADQLNDAQATYDALGDAKLSADQQARRDRARLELLLKTGQNEPALTLAQTIAQQGDSAATAGRLLLDAADAAITTKHTEQAAQLLAGAGKILASAADADLLTRLQNLRAKLTAAQQTTSPEVNPQPAPPTPPAPAAPAASAP